VNVNRVKTILSGCTNCGGTVRFFCAKFTETGKLFPQKEKNILQKVFSEQEKFCNRFVTFSCRYNGEKL
jgi:hypothetical protein